MARRRSSLLFNVSIIVGLVYVSGCSLKDTKYLSEGKTEAKGGNNTRGGSAGDAGAGGSSGSGNSGGESSTTTAPECSAEKTKCDGVAECVNLNSGTASGATYDHCGSCTNTCNLSNAVSSTCNTGACLPLCNAGFKDCNATTANDGCETDIATVIACGDCGRACSKVGTSGVACTSGKCAPTCIGRYRDCNVDTGVGSDDGCESDLSALDHCGTTCSNWVTCSLSQVCNSGVCGSAQGVVQLSVPFDPAGKSTAESMLFAVTFPTKPSVVDSSLNLRLYAPGATGGTVLFYMSDSAYTAGTGVQVPLNSFSAGWVDVKLLGGHVGGSWDPSAITQVNIQITASGTPPFASPTLMYVDSVWSSNGLINETFDTSAGRFAKSSRTFLEGSQFTWFDAIP